MKHVVVIFCFLLPASLIGQDYGFPFGKISLVELQENIYLKDTTASAVFLDEYGETSFEDGDDYNLIFKYHAKIKILKQNGLTHGNIEIPLYKSGTRTEQLVSIKASSYSLDNSSLREIPVETKKIFTERVNKYLDVKKIAFPNVKVGSVIEIEYMVETPFFYNFRPWEFQAEIPKIKSEYVARIPAIYTYNITLKGFLKLSKNESQIQKTCLSRGGSFAIDCSHMTYGMKNIPAFREEDYMTSKKNFISAIHFELSEIRSLNGAVDKITKEWKDVEFELKKHDNFGIELKKNGDLMNVEIQMMIAADTDPLTKARKIYSFVQQYFEWDGTNDKYCDGIKTAVQSKKGNSADINLFLVGALREQGMQAFPVILSTRDNGQINDLYPMISSFNYVIASVIIADKTYLLDATDDFFPFGMLPEKCLNGKGRLLGENGSSWVDLKSNDRAKNLVMINIQMEKDGNLRGTIQSTYMGYEAIDFRKSVLSHGTEEEYLQDLRGKLPEIEITKMELSNVKDFDKAAIRKLEIEISGFDDHANSFLFNPFILLKWKENPFKSDQRLYPVDFGNPIEMTMVLNLEFPQEIELVNLPERVGLSLPNSGGRYILDVQSLGNKITISNSFLINKTVFTSQEYHYLRELFQKVVEVQSTDLLFKKKI